uniref:Uncharacterized protein n=1 Tax=uncultured marine virus TaxID=186617 RepID=A0A0F7L2T8_9VIRU|nr:hypothetical protein [uncultured marine virus]
MTRFTRSLGSWFLAYPCLPACWNTSPVCGRSTVPQPELLTGQVQLSSRTQTAPPYRK